MSMMIINSHKLKREFNNIERSQDLHDQVTTPVCQAHLLLHFLHLLCVLVEDVFTDKVWSLELFVAERTEPLVLG